MIIADIIRQIADVVDAQEAKFNSAQQLSQTAQAAEIEAARTSANDLNAGQVAQLVQAAQNAKQAAGEEPQFHNTDTTTMPSEPDSAELTTAINIDNTDSDHMVPPLQQKHELLKKATDVENNVAKFADSIDDETADMQRLAGIHPAVTIIANDTAAEVD